MLEHVDQGGSRASIPGDGQRVVEQALGNVLLANRWPQQSLFSVVYRGESWKWKTLREFVQNGSVTHKFPF